MVIRRGGLMWRRHFSQLFARVKLYYTHTKGVTQHIDSGPKSIATDESNSFL